MLPLPNKNIASFVLLAGILTLYFGYMDLIYPIPGIHFSDLILYSTYALQILDGQVPYHEFTVEYPPFALVFFVLPCLFADTYMDYRILFKVMALFFCIAGLFMTGLLGKRYNAAPIKMMTVYTAAVVAVGPLISERFDIFAAVMTFAALYAFLSEHRMTAWFLLALATATKLYPVLLAPVFLALYLPDIRQGLRMRKELREKDGGEKTSDKDGEEKTSDILDRTLKKIASGLLVFAATGLFVSLPFMLTDLPAFLSFLTYHTDRGLQIESLASGIIMVLYTIGVDAVADVAHDFSYGSNNIHGAVPDGITGFLTPIMLLIIIASYLFFARFVLKNAVLKKDGEQLNEFVKKRNNAAAIMMTSFAIVLIFILAGKVFSPQYLIWSLPLVPAAFLFGTDDAPKRRKRKIDRKSVSAKKKVEPATVYPVAMTILFLIAGVLTYQIYPMRDAALNAFEPTVVALLFARNLIILILLAFVVYSIGQADPKRQRIDKKDERAKG